MALQLYPRFFAMNIDCTINSKIVRIANPVSFVKINDAALWTRSIDQILLSLDSRYNSLVPNVQVWIA